MSTVYVEGQRVELTTANDELGAICFGDQWPLVKSLMDECRPASTFFYLHVTSRPPNLRKRRRNERLAERMRQCQ